MSDPVEHVGQSTEALTPNDDDPCVSDLDCQLSHPGEAYVCRTGQCAKDDGFGTGSDTTTVTVPPSFDVDI